MEDHKQNFTSAIQCRVINPNKPELRKTSKLILGNVNNEKQCETMEDERLVMNGFRSTKPNFTIQFDIRELYPSLTENILDYSQTYLRNLSEKILGEI